MRHGIYNDTDIPDLLGAFLFQGGGTMRNERIILYVIIILLLVLILKLV